MRTLAFLILLGICFYQEWRIEDLIGGLAHDEEVLNSIIWDQPPTPNLPREEALYNLAHPREQ